MAVEAERIDPEQRACSRCAHGMERVELRSGRVWRCPSCRQLEI